jgi:hypothetical protein
MNRGQSLSVQLVNYDGNPLAVGNVIVDVSFFLEGQRRYGFRLGETDSQGRLHLRYGDVERARLRNLEFQTWDYKTKLEDCDARVLVSIPSKEELEEALITATTFNEGTVPTWARNWATASNGKLKCGETLVELLQQDTTVRVSCELL